MHSFILITIQVLFAVFSKSSALFKKHDCLEHGCKYDLAELRKLSFPSYPNCGVPKNSGIENDRNQQISSIPKLDLNDMTWIVSIKTVNNDTHVCDGVLVIPNAVMTAAHCIENYISQKDNLMVLAGIPKYSKRSGIMESIPLNYKRRISDIYLHPNYQACSRYNNQAILSLSSAFILDKFVNVACLPNALITFNSLNCDLKLIETSDAIDKHYNSGKCVNEALIDNDSSKTLSILSCEQGNNSSDLIRETHGYLMSCKLLEDLNQFYYLGVQTYVTLCGEERYKYRFYDSTVYYLKWLYETLNEIYQQSN